MIAPASLIEHLDLKPHPEGGWYRETWRASSQEGERGTATAIYFLLEQGQRSEWHSVDATEIWLWHAGHAVDLCFAANDEGPIEEVCLGPNILAGQSPQHIIPPGEWQAAEAAHGWALVSCIVSPAFLFEGFTMAPAGWKPGHK